MKICKIAVDRKEIHVISFDFIKNVTIYDIFK